MFVVATIWVLVYEKNGLKRGPPLTHATFARSFPEDWATVSASGPVPLAGGSPLYQVNIRAWNHEYNGGRLGTYNPFNLVVTAPGHYPASYPFREANFEARLDRM